MDIALKYGCNPHQTPASVTVPEESGFTVLSGRPGYINFLDALGAWQLVRELRAATGKPAAASFKHVSPAGAAVAGELSAAYRASQLLGDEDFSPLATAYARARGGDRMCSFGDVAAVSDVVDLSLAKLLYGEVSDLIIAPGFEPEALELLKTKRDGAYMVLAIDPRFEPADTETREVFGFTMAQKRNTTRVTPELFQTAGADAEPLPAAVLETLVVATVAVGVLLVVEAIALVRARAWVERVYVPLGMVAAVLAGVRCGLWLVTGVPPSTWLAEVAATLPALLLCGTSLLRAHHLAERDAVAALHAD